MTNTPPEDLGLRCDGCDGLLTFASSIIGGVHPVEQWDMYACRRCTSTYEYRRRTRKLRRVG